MANCICLQVHDPSMGSEDLEHVTFVALDAQPNSAGPPQPYENAASLLQTKSSKLEVSDISPSLSQPVLLQDTSLQIGIFPAAQQGSEIASEQTILLSTNSEDNQLPHSSQDVQKQGESSLPNDQEENLSATAPDQFKTQVDYAADTDAEQFEQSKDMAASDNDPLADEVPIQASGIQSRKEGSSESAQQNFAAPGLPKEDPDESVLYHSMLHNSNLLDDDRLPEAEMQFSVNPLLQRPASKGASRPGSAANSYNSSKSEKNPSN